MAIFAVSLSIVEDSTARWRYQTAAQAIRTDARLCWNQAPSLFLIDSHHESSAAVASTIIENSALSPGKDILVVINLASAHFETIGLLADRETLETLLKRRRASGLTPGP